MTTDALEVSGGSGIIHRYFEQLPVTNATPIVTLCEGATPLIASPRLSDEVGADVWLKYEGLNPTGSFKDRGMTLAITKALERGSRVALCASTGNTSASAAAYAARAGMTCAVLIPRGNVATGKLAQALVHGARVLEIDGNFDLALKLSHEIARAHPVTLVNSVNPFRIEGQKTAAFEVVEALNRAPDIHVMPVGNAGNITAYWRGYREARDLGWCSSLPKMYGIQAKGADPIVRGEPVEDPETVASAIRIGNPASWTGATDAAAASGGLISSVSDTEIIDAYRSLAADGIFAEVASAASIAGLRQLAERDLIPPRSTVTCVLTGHGLKDPDQALTGAAATPVPAELGPILEALELA